MGAEYNLSIFCVDSTIYGCISWDKKQLKKFLLQYDHEGSVISLVRSDMGPDGSVLTDLGGDPNLIYKELEP